jgi:hypothetical protein
MGRAEQNIEVPSIRRFDKGIFRFISRLLAEILFPKVGVVNDLAFIGIDERRGLDRG